MVAGKCWRRFVAIRGKTFFLALTQRLQIIGRRLHRRRLSRWWLVLLLIIFFGVPIGWYGPRYLSIRAGWLLLQPTEDSFDPVAKQAVLQMTGDLRARVVWSSSRSGNHEIYLMTVPELVTYRLTNNDQVDYFPRFSPDGKQIVFARSQRPWVSERQIEPWDIFVLTIADGTERLLARDANFPQWVDNNQVSFLRNGRQVVVINIENGQEQLVAPAPWMPAEWSWFVLAEFSPRDRKQLVVIAPPHGMFHLDLEHKSWQSYGSKGACEITWAPDASYLLWMQSRGQGGTRVMSSQLRPEQEDIFLDLPGEFSHEYFPRLSRDGRWLIFGASAGGHEHDLADYEIFLWQVGQPWGEAVRLTINPANDRWPDIFIQQ